MAELFFTLIIRAAWIDCINADLLDNNQSIQISWKKGKNVVTGATGTAVGTGASNTQKIVNALGTTASMPHCYVINIKQAYIRIGIFLPKRNWICFTSKKRL
jgi:hypothetical protein